MVENSKMVSASGLLQSADASGHSWEQAYDTLTSVLEEQMAAGCPKWHRERKNTASLVVKAAKTLQQELHGTGMATASPCMVIHQERVIMAASRLTRRAVQHYHATVRNAPTMAAPQHIHFAAVSSTNNNKTGITEEAEGLNAQQTTSVRYSNVSPIRKGGLWALVFSSSNSELTVGRKRF